LASAMPNSWIEALNLLNAKGEAHVLITLIGSSGSTPRESGTKMVASRDTIYGSIGGGHLEFRCLEIAAGMLAAGTENQRIEHFPLGASLGQCCGGSHTVLFESFMPCSFNIALFGAGHVGRSLCGILQQLPCRIWWVDSREQQHPTDLPANVKAVWADDPHAEVASLPASSYYLIMTHNHQMDFAILAAVLRRGDAGYIGLIGSRTKWRRFQLRLENRGHAPEVYHKVNCPAGLSQVPGKMPVEVAVSIAGQVIAHYHATCDTPAEKPAHQGVRQHDVANLLGAAIAAASPRGGSEK